jgi:hypothetical protein
MPTPGVSVFSCYGITVHDYPPLSPAASGTAIPLVTLLPDTAAMGTLLESMMGQSSAASLLTAQINPTQVRD